MKRRRFRPLIAAFSAISLCFFSPVEVKAIPAPRKQLMVLQSDGSTLSLYKVGDEYHHRYLSPEGYTVLPDKQKTYRYAVLDNAGQLVPGPMAVLAHPEEQPATAAYLQSLPKYLKPSANQMEKAVAKRISVAQSRNQLRAATAGRFDNILLNNFVKTGSAKSLVILVNFDDINFSHSRSSFDDLLNKTGYASGNHIGSVKEYFQSNSMGAFSPEFVVVGPVTVSRNREYYGANDEDDNDLRPWEMVREACQAAANLTDFSQFDSDNNGVVDNVYLFYADKGEADTDIENTIWPHSYNLSYAGINLTIDGKKVDSYACSAELSGNGQMTGIGVFTHEFAHVLGLPDMYDVDYDLYNGEAFDQDAWSLMAAGAYNGGGAVPAGLTLLERYLLGWAEPTELNAPLSTSLGPLVTTNQGFIINTNNSKEFFLVENRQKLSDTWDYYIPHHGLLVYHIDMRDNASTALNYYGKDVSWTYEKLWQYNMVNALSTHQCADIIEADNKQIIYKSTNYSLYVNSLKGDPFPGQTGVTSLTATTTPGLKTWSGKAVDKPLTAIREQNNNVLFDFMGGNLVMGVPVVRPASQIQPFSFTANWNAVEDATGYLLDVFTLQTVDTGVVKTYVNGYWNRFVKDTTLSITVKDALTTYFYQVRSTNGYAVSENSPMIVLVTTNSQPEGLPATEVDAFGFRANWEGLPWASGYYISVYEVMTNNDTPTITPVSKYTDYYVKGASTVIEELDNDREYAYDVKGTTGVSIGAPSELIFVSTAAADKVVSYYRDGILFVKGGDRNRPITLYNHAGEKVQTTYETEFTPNHKGLFFVEVWIKGHKKISKVLVN